MSHYSMPPSEISRNSATYNNLIIKVGIVSCSSKWNWKIIHYEYRRWIPYLAPKFEIFLHLWSEKFSYGKSYTKNTRLLWGGTTDTFNRYNSHCDVKEKWSKSDNSSFWLCSTSIWWYRLASRECQFLSFILPFHYAFFTACQFPSLVPPFCYAFLLLSITLFNYIHFPDLVPVCCDFKEVSCQKLWLMPGRENSRPCSKVQFKCNAVTPQWKVLCTEYSPRLWLHQSTI